MRTAMLAVSLAMTILATAAMAQKVTYDYDRSANFSGYRTYAWARGTELNDELNHARIVRSIDAALMAKGLTRVDTNADPDVLVNYHASFEQDLEVVGSTHGLGPFGIGGDRWGTARVQPVLVGTLMVDIADARRGAIVWRSLASSDIRSTDKPESKDRKIAKATQKMFKNFPPR